VALRGRRGWFALLVVVCCFFINRAGVDSPSYSCTVLLLQIRHTVQLRTIVHRLEVCETSIGLQSILLLFPNVAIVYL
jgi:hypothetical protein